MMKLAAQITLLAAAVLSLTACTGGQTARAYDIPTGGAASRGITAIAAKNCGSCHTIPGIQGAHGVVGPPLYFFGRRTYIAGEIPNSPDNLVRWIRSPQSVEPHTAMPDLGVTEQQARDIAAYLYTLR
jgi:cytochrome c1